MTRSKSKPARLSWRSLAWVVLGAAIALFVIELALRQVAPDPRLREVTDGLHDLAAHDPTTLVIGSSHARTFHALGQELARRTNRDMPLVAIPLELGKLEPYRWLLENRVAPIIAAPAALGNGQPRRLKRLILLTEWWDSCDHDDGRHPNLPSRAWHWPAYRDNMLREGITTHNRDYLRRVVRERLGFSRLVLDRSFPGIRRHLLARARGLDAPPGRNADEEARFLEGWISMTEQGARCQGAATQMDAFREIIAFARKRGLEMHVVLFPRKPGTATETARRLTFAPFRALIESEIASQDIFLHDLSFSTPLGDDDFMADYDHVNGPGNAKFARWALAGPFAFLLRPETETAHRPVRQRAH